MFTLPNVNILLLLKDEYFENTTFSKSDHHPLFLFNTKNVKTFYKNPFTNFYTSEQLYSVDPTKYSSGYFHNIETWYRC